MTSKVSNLLVIDSLGYPLSNDLVHLQTSGLIDLGERLARGMRSLVMKESSALPLDNAKDQMRQINSDSDDTSVSIENIKLEKHFQERIKNETEKLPVIPIGDKCSVHHIDFTGYNLQNVQIKREIQLLLLYNSAYQQSEKRLTENPNLFTLQCSTELKSSMPDLEGDSSICPKNVSLSVKSGLKAVNFVSGDIRFIDFIRLLDRVVCCDWMKRVDNESQNQNVSPINKKFYDLGCGSGTALVGAVLSGYFTAVTGIDLLHSKVIQSNSLLTTLKSLLSDSMSTVSKSTDEDEHMINSFPNISISESFKAIHANFLDDLSNSNENYTDKNKFERNNSSYCNSNSNSTNHLPESNTAWWNDADVVYIASTVFAEDLMIRLVIKLLLLPLRARIIMLDKRIENYITREDGGIGMELNMCPGIKLTGSCQCRSSW
eukprot:CAMPEP_0182416450 /NCGR_PEP_ID=MMETSP1167-20130531/734_1 /TAXON_ID=2988 /ORGANISM="Mallomonas Sp, Strain CCMP3275" /LENGTH=431 /DNA_ID=CAMNT_0024589201 /DNA_START=199 /DNA_END=1491 /DNA_ORIENTATION=-